MPKKTAPAIARKAAKKKTAKKKTAKKKTAKKKERVRTKSEVADHVVRCLYHYRKQQGKHEEAEQLLKGYELSKKLFRSEGR